MIGIELVVLVAAALLADASDNTVVSIALVSIASSRMESPTIHLDYKKKHSPRHRPKKDLWRQSF